MSTLDASILEELRALAGVEGLRETIALFRSGVDKNFLALHEQQGDAKALARTAHSLRGSCAVMGARSMALLAEQLEDIVRAGGSAGVAELVDQLEGEYRLTLLALDAEVGRAE